MAGPQMTRYWFKTDNGMYWSNNYSSTVYMSTAKTMSLAQKNDQTNFFEMNGTGAGGGKKYLVTADGSYLQWQMAGDLATVTKSKYNTVTNDWNSIPQQDKAQLTFVFETVNNGDTFRLYVTSPSKTQLYLKRVQGGSQYIVGINPKDPFGIFTKILA